MLQCKVATVRRGAVNAEIDLDVSPTIKLVVIITEGSVKSLSLEPGSEVFALIKSSFVMLAPEGEVGRTSARNVLHGTVARREDGAVNSEIAIDIGGGKTLIATVTLESARALALEPGGPVTVLVKAPHVILAVE